MTDSDDRNLPGAIQHDIGIVDLDQPGVGRVLFGVENVDGISLPERAEIRRDRRNVVVAEYERKLLVIRKIAEYFV